MTLRNRSDALKIGDNPEHRPVLGSGQWSFHHFLMSYCGTIFRMPRYLLMNHQTNEDTMKGTCVNIPSDDQDIQSFRLE